MISVLQAEKISQNPDQKDTLEAKNGLKEMQLCESSREASNTIHESEESPGVNSDNNLPTNPQDEMVRPDESRSHLRDGATLPGSLLEEESESETDDDTDSDDGGGWITPNNIAAVKKSLGEPKAERANVPVACLTTDFAMQVQKITLLQTVYFVYLSSCFRPQT